MLVYISVSGAGDLRGGAVGGVITEVKYFVFIIPRHTLVSGYYAIPFSVCPSVRPSVRPSVLTISNR